MAKRKRKLKKISSSGEFLGFTSGSALWITFRYKKLYRKAKQLFHDNQIMLLCKCHEKLLPAGLVCSNKSVSKLKYVPLYSLKNCNLFNDLFLNIEFPADIFTG